MRRRRAGYTLLELLVSLAIFAAILGGVSGMVWNASQAQRDGRELARVDRVARRVMGSIVRDLENALPGQPDTPFHEPGFEGADDDLDGAPKDRLRLTTSSGRYDFGLKWSEGTLGAQRPMMRRSDIVEVEYLLVLDPNNTEGRLVGLYRRERALITSALTDADAQWTERRLAAEVSSLDLTYADRDGNWFDDWLLSEKEGEAPKMVQVVLEVDLVVDRDPSEREELREQEADEGLRSPGRRRFLRQVALTVEGVRDQSESAKAGEPPQQEGGQSGGEQPGGQQPGAGGQQPGGQLPGGGGQLPGGGGQLPGGGGGGGGGR